MDNSVFSEKHAKKLFHSYLNKRSVNKQVELFIGKKRF